MKHLAQDAVREQGVQALVVVQKHAARSAMVSPWARYCQVRYLNANFGLFSTVSMKAGSLSRRRTRRWVWMFPRTCSTMPGTGIRDGALRGRARQGALRVQIGWDRRREGSGVNRTCRHRVPLCALVGRWIPTVKIRGRCCSAEDLRGKCARFHNYRPRGRRVNATLVGGEARGSPVAMREWLCCGEKPCLNVSMGNSL